MSDATVRGAFELEGRQAIQTLTTIRDRGREADRSLETLGRRMDTLATKSEGAWARVTRTVDTHVDRIEGRLEGLNLKLRDLGNVTATPSVNLGGVAVANAQISELQRRLDSLSRSTASPRIAIGGGFSNLVGGGGDGGGGGGSIASTGGDAGRTFSSLGGVGGRLPWWAMLAPLAPSLLGGAGALVGSAGSAALGAGAVGLGGAATLGVGGGLSALAFKPALTGLQAVTKAQLAYNKAVAEFGRQSTQAATAQTKLNYAIVQNPAAAGAARQDALLRQEWQAASMPARVQAYRGISGVLYNARRAVPWLGRDMTTATGATSTAAIRYSGFLAGQQTQQTAGTLTRAFATELPTAERTLQNMTSTLEHLSVAAIPFFHEANVWVQHWSAGLASSSSHTAEVQAKMRGYVNSAKDWARLTGAAFRTIRDIFSAGTPAGDSMVVQLTHTLDRWDSWINRNPQKVSGFFQSAAAQTSHIANTLSKAVKDIWQLLQSAAPFVDRIVQALGFVSGLGPGGIGLGGAALYGAYGGLRGATGGRLPSAGALGSAFVMGGAGPGLMRSAGRGGGGTLVGGGAYTSALAGRAGGGTYLMPPRGFQAGGGAALPLFAAGAAGYVMRGGAAAATAARGEMAFNQAFGGVEGARYAPLEAGATRAYGLSRLAGPLGSAVEGAARFALPVLGISALLQGAQTPGNLGNKIQGGINAGLHMASFGILPKNSVQQLLGNVNAGPGLNAPAVRDELGRIQAQVGAVRTPGDLHRVQAAVGRVRLQYDLSPDEAQRLRKFLWNASWQAAQNAGAAASNTWQDAFTRALDRGVKPEKAVKTLLGGIGTSLRQLGPQGRRALASGTAAWVAQLEADNPKLRRPLERMMSGVVADLNRLQHTTGTTMKDLQDKVFYFNGQILTGTTATWKQIGRALTDPAQVAQERLSGIFGMIQAEAINALTGMGFSRSQAKGLVNETIAGKALRAGAQTQVSAKAQGYTISQGAANRTRNERGGMIQGKGLLDTVQMPDGGLAAPGEAYIANRHTMNDLSRATIPMYGKTAWQMINGEHRTHSAPARARGGGLLGQVIASAAGARGSGGDWVQRAHPELHPGIAQAVQDVLARFPLSITSTTSGTHASHSYHYLGEAADIAGSSGLMYRASEWIKSSGLAKGLTEGIHNPNLAVYHGQIMSGAGPFGAVWAGHTNHIHMAVAGALNALIGGGGVGGGGGGGALGGRPVRLRAPRSGLGGIPGLMADTGSAMYAAGLSKKLTGRVGASGGMNLAGFTGGGSSGANQALGRRMMLAAGWGAGEWPSLQALWTQESGWNANAVNSSSGAYGIPQSLGHGHPYNLGDAPAQIAWGLNYIKGRYGSPSAAEAHERNFNWYARGGHARWGGWHGRGTDFTTRGPTVIGVGEMPGRRERVQVTPASTPTGSGHSIKVVMERVYLGSGDAADAERVAQDVAERILKALDNVGVGGSDSELIGAGS